MSLPEGVIMSPSINFDALIAEANREMSQPQVSMQQLEFLDLMQKRASLKGLTMFDMAMNPLAKLDLKDVKLASRINRAKTKSAVAFHELETAKSIAKMHRREARAAKKRAAKAAKAAE